MAAPTTVWLRACLYLSGAGLLASAASSDTQMRSLRAREVKEPTRPSWMATDTALQAPVQVDVTGRSLAVALGRLTERTGVTLQADRRLREYRVSIHLPSRPLRDVMARLQDTLGHGTIPAASCTWSRVVADGRVVRYELVPTLRGAREEADLLVDPLQAAGRRLREWRDYLRLNSAGRKAFRTDWPTLRDAASTGATLTDAFAEGAPLEEAVAGLTDAHIDRLLTTGGVPVPHGLSAAAWEQVRERMPADLEAPAGTGLGLTLDRFADTEPYDVVLTVDTRPAWQHPMRLALPLPVAQNPPGPRPPSVEEEERAEKAAEIDLLRGETGGGGRIPTVTLSAALALWARRTGRPVVAEIFLRRPDRLPVTRGKPEHLLTRICGMFGCDWRKVGADYVVWSNNWAQDRAADVPQPLLDRWARAYERRGRFELADLLEMARLTDRQLPTLVLQHEVAKFAFAGPRTNRDGLRVLASLPKADLAGAEGEPGVTLRPAGPNDLAVLRRVFGRSDLRPPVRVWYVREAKGTSIWFADAAGRSAPAWAYHGPPIPGELKR